MSRLWRWQSLCSSNPALARWANFWRAYGASEEGRARRLVPLPELSAVDWELSAFSPKSNYSRTYEPFSRKSNYSRTYAKQGGGVGYLNGNVPKICRRADNSILAAERRQTQEPVPQSGSGHYIDWPGMRIVRCFSASRRQVSPLRLCPRRLRPRLHARGRSFRLPWRCDRFRWCL